MKILPSYTLLGFLPALFTMPLKAQDVEPDVSFSLNGNFVSHTRNDVRPTVPLENIPSYDSILNQILLKSIDIEKSARFFPSLEPKEENEQFFLKSDQPDSLGFYHFAHKPEHNAVVTLAGLLDLINPNYNMPIAEGTQIAQDFLMSKGHEVSQDRFRISYKNDGSVANVIYNRDDAFQNTPKTEFPVEYRQPGWEGRVLITQGDVVPVRSDLLEIVDQELVEFAERYKAMAQPIAEYFAFVEFTENAIRKASEDGIVTQDELTTIIESYEPARESLANFRRMSADLLVDYETTEPLDASVPALNQIRDAFTKYANGLKAIEPVSQDSASSVENEITTEGAKSTKFQLDLGYTVFNQGEKDLGHLLGADVLAQFGKIYAGLGLGVQLDGEVRTDYNEPKVLPDGTEFFSSETLDTGARYGASVRAGANLTDFFGVGVRSLFLTGESIRSKVEGQRNSNGLEETETTFTGRKNTTQTYLGADLSMRLPVPQIGGELVMTPGLLYDVDNNSVHTAVNFSYRINLNGGQK